MNERLTNQEVYAKGRRFLLRDVRPVRRSKIGKKREIRLSWGFGQPRGIYYTFGEWRLEKKKWVPVPENTAVFTSQIYDELHEVLKELLQAFKLPKEEL